MCSPLDSFEIDCSQQWPDWSTSLFNLPERIASMLDIANRIQCADLCKKTSSFLFSSGNSLRKIVNRSKPAFCIA